MALTLTVLGCAGSFPGKGAACSGYLLRDGTTTVWLDAGSGTMANLQRHVELGDVDAIVLSHEHPDHWRDVEGYHIACKYYLERSGVPVYAPKPVRGLAYWDTAPTLVWHTVADGDSVDIGTMRFTFSRTQHPVETLACRVDAGGRTFAYSADTGPGWTFAPFGRGIDTVLCEATMPDISEPSALHLNAAQAGELALQAGATRLVLTHFWPGVDLARAVADAGAIFGGSVLAAVENMEIEI